MARSSSATHAGRLTGASRLRSVIEASNPKTTAATRLSLHLEHPLRDPTGSNPHLPRESHRWLNNLFGWSHAKADRAEVHSAVRAVPGESYSTLSGWLSTWVASSLQTAPALTADTSAESPRARQAFLTSLWSIGNDPTALWQNEWYGWTNPPFRDVISAVWCWERASELLYPAQSEVADEDLLLEISARFAQFGQVAAVYYLKYRDEIQITVATDLASYDLGLMGRLLDEEYELRNLAGETFVSFSYPATGAISRRDIIHPEARLLYVR